MRIILVIGIFSVLSIWFRARIFEALIWSLLTTPVFAYLLSPVLGVSASTYIPIFLIAFLGWCFIYRNELSGPFYKSVTELYTLGILSVSYIGIYLLTQQWDQFFPMGERLRDYALLSSAIRSPITLTDPWLHGYNLNYYAYWYRFGHFLSSILGIGTPETYNQLQSLTYAIFLTSTYRITTRFLNWSPVSAIFSTIIIGFGSNLEGIFSVLQKSDNWWGPSRVIPGAIHEFPVWSFLLGDLHPHFLNLAGIPSLLLLLLHTVSVQSVRENLVSRLVAAGLFLITGALFIYNANAWEVPIWGLLVGGIALSWMIAERKDLLRLKSPLGKSLKMPGLWIGVVIAMSLSYSLWTSSRNILPNPFPISWVSAPVLRTTALDFMRHWGIPATLVIVSLTTIASSSLLAIAMGAITLGTLIYPTILPLLLVALCLLSGKFLIALWSTSNRLSLGEQTLYVSIISAVILCLIPEFIFLDDPYGGENERMNTIFKIYSSNWLLFHLGALFLFRKFIYSQIPFAVVIKYTSYGVVIALCCSFFLHTKKLRATKTESSVAAYGSLASAEDHFPGSASTIQYLRAQPGAVVLEAQGNAYDWTSFVSTLSDKDSYLGWANHVNLLIREYGEISRREKITDLFYTTPSCEERKRILEQERIDYAVVGVLEEKKHPAARTLDYSCLKEAYARERYRVFSR